MIKDQPAIQRPAIQRPAIQNVVATASAGCPLDLPRLAGAIPDAIYEPDVFPAMTIRMVKPRTGTLVFANGKMVCAGAASEEAATRAVHTIQDILRKHSPDVTHDDTIQVRNIVALGYAGAAIDLCKAVPHLHRSMYEPEMFPGIIWRLRHPRVTVSIFSTGRLLFTGAKSLDDAVAAQHHTRFTLQSCGMLPGGPA